MRLIGHRGARGEAPENTLSGFRHLRQLGLRAVEFDIQVSADNELVVIHDPRLERTTSGHGPVRDRTADAMTALDACHKSFPSWPDSDGVPRLEDVLALLDDFEHLELEVKSQTPEEESVVIARLPELWQRFRLAGRARTTSFNPRYLQGMREAAPDIARGFLFEADFHGDALQVAQALGCSSLGPHQSRCQPALVQAAHDAGLIVSTWTVNDAGRARELDAMGVDGLITDIPSQALGWL